MNYIIGSGFWSSDVDEQVTNPERKIIGDNLIRKPEFFPIWLNSIRKCSNPNRIVIVDSHSPIKPDFKDAKDVVWIELPINAKHATNHIGTWSGWTRSVILSGQYALNAEVDYFVYIEQDCLLSGAGIVEYCIEHMKKGLMFGDGKDTPQPIQQSFFIIEKRQLAKFLYNLCSLSIADRYLSPEWKFIISTWTPIRIAANLGFLNRPATRRLICRLMSSRSYDNLPVGCGRARPIPWKDRFFYFQHGTSDEIEYYFRHTASEGRGLSGNL